MVPFDLNDCKYYLALDEEQPHRAIGHKSHIPKCMHLAANGRPRWDAGRNRWFNGKLGLWPVAHQVAAQRRSRHRPAGTLEWKSLSLTKVVYGRFLFDKVVPSILQSWPRDNRRIRIQQDNATPHLSPAEVARIEDRFAKYSWGRSRLGYRTLLSTCKQPRHECE